MTTLLLRLEGPMQAWGTQSRFTDRDTGLEPSKSGVLGLLCAALGRPREAHVSDLAALRMGARTDRPGTLQRDYQTAGARYPRFNKKGEVIGTRDAVVSPRYYLADASSLVGLEGDGGLLRGLDGALRRPARQLYLGRKAFVPSVPICLPDGASVTETDLRTALLDAPLPADESPRHHTPDRVQLVLEVATREGAEVRYDTPLSFLERRFAPRYVITTWEAVP